MNSSTAAGTAAGLGGTLINGQSVDPAMNMISGLQVITSSFSVEYEHSPVVVNFEFTVLGVSK